RSAFATIAEQDPADSRALYDQALCLAWLGRNSEAIALLDRVVSLLAESDPDRAEGSWLLAEVLRFGAGAEALADDLSYSWVLPRPPDAMMEQWPNLNARAPKQSLDVIQIYDWLDQPPSEGGASPIYLSRPTRALAVVILTASELRILTPDPSAFD